MRSDTGGTTSLEGNNVTGQGPAYGWRIRKLQLFAACFFCKGLVKKGERVYVKIAPNHDDLYCHIAHGNPENWDLK